MSTDICQCLKTNGTACTRKIETKSGADHKYCWQHQKCGNPKMKIGKPEIKCSQSETKTSESKNKYIYVLSKLILDGSDLHSSSMDVLEIDENLTNLQNKMFGLGLESFQFMLKNALDNQILDVSAYSNSDELMNIIVQSYNKDIVIGDRNEVTLKWYRFFDKIDITMYGEEINSNGYDSIKYQINRIIFNR